MKRRVADIVGVYWATGRIDLSVRSWAPEPPVPESPALLDALADYDRDNHARGLAKGTRDYYWRLAREFAVYLEGRGIASLDDVGPGDVLGFVADILGRWKGTDGRHLATNFRPFLKYLGRADLMVIIMRREHRPFRGLRIGAHAVWVSPVSPMRIATSYRRATCAR